MYEKWVSISTAVSSSFQNVFFIFHLQGLHPYLSLCKPIQNPLWSCLSLGLKRQFTVSLYMQLLCNYVWVDFKKIEPWLLKIFFIYHVYKFISSSCWTSIQTYYSCTFCKGGNMAWWLGCWTCNLDVPGSNPAPCH